MRKMWILALANIRKTKGLSFVLLILFITAALLFNLGALVFMNFSSYFEDMTKELKASDVYCLIPKNLYNEDMTKYINDNKNITEKQVETDILLDGSIPYRSETRETSILLCNKDRDRSLTKWKLIGEHLPLDKNGVYVPYIMQIDGGYQLNDTIKLKCDGKESSFTIKGFVEDTYFSYLDTGILAFYLSEDTFDEMSKKWEDRKFILLFANQRDDSKDLLSGIRKELDKDNLILNEGVIQTVFGSDIKLARDFRTSMASTIAAMYVVFAVIIVVICLVVVRFRVVNNIEEEMEKIGILKAAGHTSLQIRLALLLQFYGMGGVGILLGIAVSYLFVPAMSDVFAHQSGILWQQGFDLQIFLLSFGVLSCFTIFVSFVSSKKIVKMDPILALRGGVNNHSFKRNYLPFETTRGSLSWVLVLKNLLQNKKQSLMMMVIFAFISFAASFAMVIFYNASIDTTTFAETPGIELSDVIAVADVKTDRDELLKTVSKMEHVRKAQYLDSINIEIAGSYVSARVMEDYSKKETNKIYTGRYPIHEDEVAISCYVAEKLKKEVGDRVKIKMGGKEKEFLVTGLTQDLVMNGVFASITTKGVLEMNSDFQPQCLQIYLDDKTKPAQFVLNLEKEKDNQLLKVIDNDKSLEQGMGSYAAIVAKVGKVIMGVTLFLVILILYFVLSSLITKRKRELGIQKAIGFTTFQLMNQISLGFLPAIISGVALGAIFGITKTNSLMTMAQRPWGIMKSDFIVRADWIVCFALVMMLIAYLCSLLITARVRKISAYGLIRE